MSIFSLLSLYNILIMAYTSEDTHFHNVKNDNKKKRTDNKYSHYAAHIFLP